LTVEATTVESSNGSTTVVSKDFSVNIEAVADAATLTASDVSGREDNAIALNLGAGLTDLDGSEVLSVSINGVPEGFSLSSGTRQDDGNWSVDPSKLSSLTLSAPKDFNGQIELTVQATAREVGNDSIETISKSFTVDIADVNDLPFDIQIDNTTIVENVVPGELIATLSAADVDDETLQYRIFGENAKSFTIVGNELRISESASFSFENRPVEKLTIEVSDGRGGVSTRDIEIAISAQSRTIEGTDDNDILSGTSASDTILAGEGDDVLLGDSGADVLDGGEGQQDVVRYDESEEAVFVDLESQVGKGGDADGDTIKNVEGVIGSSLDDTLIGDKQDNLLVGNDGNDRLVGGAGNDLLVGGAGDDQLDGGDGFDVAKFSGNMSDYQFDRNQDGLLIVTDLREGSPDGTDRLVNVETVVFADKSESVGALFNSIAANQNTIAPSTSIDRDVSVGSTASNASDSVRGDAEIGQTVRDLESLASELRSSDPIGLAAPEYVNPNQYVTLPPIEKIDWSNVKFNNLVDLDAEIANTGFETSRTEANVSVNRSGESNTSVQQDEAVSTLKNESSTLSKLWALVRAYGGLRQK